MWPEQHLLENLEDTPPLKFDLLFLGRLDRAPGREEKGAFLPSRSSCALNPPSLQVPSPPPLPVPGEENSPLPGLGRISAFLPQKLLLVPVAPLGLRATSDCLSAGLCVRGTLTKPWGLTGQRPTSSNRDSSSATLKPSYLSAFPFSVLVRKSCCTLPSEAVRRHSSALAFLALCCCPLTCFRFFPFHFYLFIFKTVWFYYFIFKSPLYPHRGA